MPYGRLCIVAAHAPVRCAAEHRYNNLQSMLRRSSTTYCTVGISLACPASTTVGHGKGSRASQTQSICSTWSLRRAENGLCEVRRWRRPGRASITRADVPQDLVLSCGMPWLSDSWRHGQSCRDSTSILIFCNPAAQPPTSCCDGRAGRSGGTALLRISSGIASLVVLERSGWRPISVRQDLTCTNYCVAASPFVHRCKTLPRPCRCLSRMT